MRVVTDPLRQAYETKSSQYFDGGRADMVAELPDNPDARLLEIGCGFGGTGTLALAHGKCKDYVGIEITESAAAVARQKLSTVLDGNVEAIDFPWPDGSFDGLIMSEVLEHLVDPWRTLNRLHPLLRRGAVVMASSPNISQYRIILSLMAGRWDLAESGVMDRTHLRWFTPASYRSMFEQCGFAVDCIRPVTPLGLRARVVDRLTVGRFTHLFMRQIFLIGHKAS